MLATANEQLLKWNEFDCDHMSNWKASRAHHNLTAYVSQQVTDLLTSSSRHETISDAVKNRQLLRPVPNV